MYSSLRESMGVDTITLNELSHLFSPEYYVKKEDLEPFVSLLNGIKYEYWDNEEKFWQVIGLLQQLNLDTSTQVLEYQQLLIKNRLSYLLQDTPELLDTLLEMISDASNNRRHVLNARPVSMGFQTTKGRQEPVSKTHGMTLFGTRPSTTFVTKTNTVTLPWQPWFAHIVPKSSLAGRTVLRLQGGKPYSLLVPKSPSSLTGPAQKVVTTAGLLTVQPARATTATHSTADKHQKQTVEFGISRKLYEQIPGSLQCPVITRDINRVEQCSSEHSKQTLLKKQQDFLQQLALLRTEQKGNQGCNKQLFPPHTSLSSLSCAHLLPPSPQLIPNNVGNNGAEGIKQSNESEVVLSENHSQTATLTRLGNTNIRMATRQSTLASKSQTNMVKSTVTNKRRSPRNKKNDTSPSPTSQQKGTPIPKSGHVGKEKGLLLSRVSEHCIVISAPNQSSGMSKKSKTKSNTATLVKSSPAINLERKKKHKKKKHHRSFSKDDHTDSPTNAKAFSRVQKLHKKRHKAWMKTVAKSLEKLAEGKSHHREVSTSNLEDKSVKIKISSDLFKTKHQLLNKNNSCSTMQSDAHTSKTKTPGKRKQLDQEETSTVSADSADLQSLLSPSCFVSLKKMKLETDGDVQSSRKAKVRYAIDQATSFPYCQHLSIPVNQCVPISDNLARHQGEPAATEDTNSCDTGSGDTQAELTQDDNQSLDYASISYSQQDQESLTKKFDQTTDELTFIDILGGSDTELYNASCSLNEEVNPISQAIFKPHISDHTDHDLERYQNGYSTDTFLGRLLTSPSPLGKNQHANTRTRQRKPAHCPVKVRKSKRQRRKRKKEKNKTGCKGCKP